MERSAAALRAHCLAILDSLSVQEVEHTALLTGAAPTVGEHELARRSLVAEIATMTTMPEACVSGQWSRAVTCVREQPQTLDALLAGEIGAAHADVLIAELECVSAPVREHLLPRALDKARTCTPAALRRWVARAREKVEPASIEKRHRAARAGRNVQLSLGREGMATISAYLPEVTASAIFHRCTDAALATRGPDDPRTLSQLRADAFAAYCLSESPVLTDLVVRPADVGPRPGARAPGDVATSAGPTGRGRTETCPDHGTPGLVGADQSALDLAGPDDRTPVQGLSTVAHDVGAPESTAPPQLTLVGSLTEGRAHAGSSFEVRRLDTAIAESFADDAELVASSACDVDIWSIRPTVMITVPLAALLPEGVARGTPNCVRSSADLGADLGADFIADSSPGSATGARPGVERTPVVDAARGVAAQVVGGGLLDAETARKLVAAAPSLRRLLTDDDTGVVLDMSRTTYAVPAALTAFVRLRDETCRFPGCRRRAERCDLDHVMAWADGGSTCAANLTHLCRHHHRLKHATGWSVTVADVGPQLDVGPRSDVGSQSDVGPKSDVVPLSDVGPADGPRAATHTGAEQRLRWTSPAGRVMTVHAALTVPVLRPLDPGDSVDGNDPPRGNSTDVDAPVLDSPRAFDVSQLPDGPPF